MADYPFAPTGGKAPKEGIRFFTLMSDNGEAVGRYSGYVPYTAAKKAATSMFREKGRTSTGTLRITIRESTRGSDRKVFTYEATRSKKANPAKRTLPNGAVFTNEYDVTLRRV
jgi:hypothetical protein